MTAQQWRLMPARRAQHGKKEATLCWLGEHAVSHHELAVQFRRQSGRTDIVALLEQTKQVCPCTLRSVTGKGDTEEQARKNAEELMTNVAKNFATGSIGRSDLFSYRNDLLKAGGWTKEEAVEKRPRDAPDDLVDATLEKGTPCTEVKKDVECTENVGNLIRQIVTVGGWTWAYIEGNVGKLSEAMKIVRGTWAILVRASSWTLGSSRRASQRTCSWKS